MNKLNAIILILTATLSMTACVDSEKDKLDNRIIEFWNYKINNDFNKAYEFLSPGWRSSEDKESYVRRMSRSVVDWLGIKIKDKKCSEKYLCVVVLEIEYEYHFKGTMAGKIRIPSDIRETWLMKDNIWYYVPNKSKFRQK
ncbi:hypothetical protein MNBD_GAMMA01-2179 [hydrothermal vent metagenome]|uniref:Lipoprotein n=1 Tax=hydrothermal vent metagenome TaxID=652676 RepID=A0A3B0UV25_9ZZZZ